MLTFSVQKCDENHEAEIPQNNEKGETGNKKRLTAFGTLSIQLHPLVGIAHCIEKLHEILSGDDEGGGVDTGMEAYLLRRLQVFINKDLDMVFHIINQTERCNRAWHDAQVLHQSLLRGETQLPLMQLLLDGVNVHVLIAVEQNQIMLVPLVVSEKEVFAMLGIVSRPILLGDFNRGRGRMFNIFEMDAEFF